MNVPPSPFPDYPPGALPPGPDPAREELKQQLADKVDSSNLGDVLGGAGDLAEVVLDSEVVTTAASAAAEVSGEVVGTALEGLGSGFEVVGGCAEGCSLMLVVAALLATAGAWGMF
jgi:hypothetical protein